MIEHEALHLAMVGSNLIYYYYYYYHYHYYYHYDYCCAAWQAIARHR